MILALVFACLVRLPNTVRGLSDIDVTRSGSVRLLTVWAVTANAVVLASVDRLHWVHISSQNPNLAHVSGFSVAGSHSENHHDF